VPDDGRTGQTIEYVFDKYEIFVKSYVVIGLSSPLPANEIWSRVQEEFLTAPHVENTNTHPFYKIQDVMASMSPRISHLQNFRNTRKLLYHESKKQWSEH